MALEIRELIIKATVRTTVGGNRQEGISPADMKALKAQVIEACMEKTKQIIEEKLNR